MFNNTDYVIATALHRQFRLSLMSNEKDDDKNSFVYPGMKKKVRVKIISLVKDLLEAQEAVSSETCSDVDAHEKPNEFLTFCSNLRKLEHNIQQKSLKRTLICTLRAMLKTHALKTRSY